GLLWLALYVLTRLSFFWKSPMMQRRAPANILYPPEPRWELVNQCLQHYNQALTRFLPPPFKLRVPPAFSYEAREDGMLITWRRWLPIIPESLLEPSSQPLLGTLLAVELGKYQSGDLIVRSWMATYPFRKPSRFLAWSGIFFWMPVGLVRSKLYKDWCKERELAYDEFAYLCGRGEGLLQMLRFNEAHNLQMFATEYEPSTSERIGHLEALLCKEHEQMTKLGLATPAL
ncbi:MAG TPA: hypothetical protein VFN35_12140, partial [Ktedonobacteraceae bacterium]|nr:hypothetical protein [Ktedonobacteraceae bacterium]